MKKAILLLTVLFTLGAVAFAQSGQNNTIPSIEEEEQMLRDRADHFSQMMEYTEDQKEKAVEIGEKYFEIYKQNKSDHDSSIKELRRYRKSLLIDAVNEMKPHLSADQWETVKEIAASRKIELD